MFLRVSDQSPNMMVVTLMLMETNGTNFPYSLELMHQKEARAAPSTQLSHRMTLYLRDSRMYLDTSMYS